MKMNKNILWAVAVVAVLLIFFSGPVDKAVKKEAGPGGAIMTRTVTPSTVHPTEQFTIRYTASAVTGSYGGIIYETIPAGFTINSLSFLNNMDVFGKKITGQLIEMPFTGTANTQFIEYTITASSASGSLASGSVEWASGAGTDTFPTASLTVCIQQSYTDCFSGERYYFDSCGIREGMAEDCEPTACSGYGANFCTGLTIEHDQTCYTSGCSGDTCTDTPYTDTEVVSSAPNSNSGTCLWSCTAGACDQNSGADTNYDGTVANSELLSFITNWIGNTVSNAELLVGITAWIG